MEEKQLKEEDVTLTALEMSDKIFELLEGKKAENIKLMDLKGVNSYFNYFLLATASSQAHLKSLVREIMKTFGELLPEGQKGPRSEDVESGWVVIDFFDLVVHIFEKEEREFYNLERLWGDAPITRKS